jgi:hypothetical protein
MSDKKKSFEDFFASLSALKDLFFYLAIRDEKTNAEAIADVQKHFDLLESFSETLRIAFDEWVNDLRDVQMISLILMFLEDRIHDEGHRWNVEHSKEVLTQILLRNKKRSGTVMLPETMGIIVETPKKSQFH